MQSVVAQVLAFYRRHGGDPSFPEVRDALRGAGDLADEISIDAEARRLLGRRCDAERWTPHLPRDGGDGAALDAIVTAVLGDESDAASFQEACRDLGRRGPEFSASVARVRLVRAVLDGAALHESEFRRHAPPFPEPPCDFGPQLRTREARFHLRRRLGEGASGAAYDAIDRRYSEDGHEHRVVVKLLPPALADRAEAEARRGSRVLHPGVVRWLDWGTSPDGFGFVVSEFAPAQSLDDASTLAALGRRGAVEVMRQAAEAIDAVHAAGIIHMDVKPANILVDAGGQARLCDFGAALPTGSTRGFEASTPFFAAPEVLDGEPPTLAADLYALGAVLRRCMDELDELGAPPLAPADAQRLEAIWLHAMARTPAERYGLARQFATDLAAWLEHRPLSVEAPSLPASLRLSVRRDPVTWALAAAAVLAVLLLAWSWMDARLASAERRNERLMEEANRLRGAAAIAKYIDRLDVLAQHDGLAASPQLMALQWLVGAGGINAPALHSRVLGAQRTAWEQIVTAAEAQGQLDRLEPRLAELCLAIELLDDRKYAEAQERMRGALPWWSDRFPIDDPVRTLADAIAVLAACGADPRGGSSNAEEWRPQLESIRASMQERAPRISRIADLLLAPRPRRTAP